MYWNILFHWVFISGFYVPLIINNFSEIYYPNGTLRVKTRLKTHPAALSKPYLIAL